MKEVKDIYIEELEKEYSLRFVPYRLPVDLDAIGRAYRERRARETAKTTEIVATEPVRTEKPVAEEHVLLEVA